jgi:hypothetical protein
MNIDFFTIQTPALLFPTISLLMLAYTNRFLNIANLIRKLHADMIIDKKNHEFYLSQIQSLSQRIELIVLAQKTGVTSLLSCVLSMVIIFLSNEISLGIFVCALTFMAISLIFIFKELSLSKEALNYILNDCKKLDKEKND